MIRIENIPQSSKQMGKYEDKIIQTLIQYFTLNGHKTIPHSRLNIAWSNIISDMDLLLIKDDILIYIEIKSYKDNLPKSLEQIERVKDYIDYAYVATDKQVSKLKRDKIGIIYIQKDNVIYIKKSKKFVNRPRFSSLMALKKKCLARFFGNDDIIKYVNKYDLACHVYEDKKQECTRKRLKEIVTCGEKCDTNCPLSN